MQFFSFCFKKKFDVLALDIRLNQREPIKMLENRWENRIDPHYLIQSKKKNILESFVFFF